MRLKTDRPSSDKNDSVLQRTAKELKKNIDLCTRCSSCMTICPVSRVTPLFPGPKQAGPGTARLAGRQDSESTKWIGLCTGCRLCDTVCPSGVPVADLTLMARASYLEAKGRPFRDWILSHYSHFAKIGSLLSFLFNPMTKSRFMRWLMESFLGISSKSGLPTFQYPTFRHWFKRYPVRGTREVALFYGCFIDTSDVDVGKAAVEVLSSIGFKVVLPPQQCCGLPVLGIGDLKGARKAARCNVSTLTEAIKSGMELVFVSTSCGYMVRHEYSRFLQVQGAEEISLHSHDISEFLVDLDGSEGLFIKLRPVPLRAAYFAPCHLRSLNIGLPALQLLRLIPGLTVQCVDADCCGLGGSFGFKKETRWVSEEIGRDLVVAIERIRPDVVLSDCEGCRLQIRHLTGMKVLHPIQILRDAMNGSLIPL